MMQEYHFSPWLLMTYTLCTFRGHAAICTHGLVWCQHIWYQLSRCFISDIYYEHIMPDISKYMFFVYRKFLCFISDIYYERYYAWYIKIYVFSFIYRKNVIIFFQVMNEIFVYILFLQCNLGGGFMFTSSGNRIVLNKYIFLINFVLMLSCSNIFFMLKLMYAEWF